MNPFDIFSILTVPTVNLLILIYHLLSSVHLPGALGLSIIILTIIIRLSVWPLFSSQMKVSKKMTELKPHLDVLKKKHGKDKKALAVAQAALYKEHGFNPAAGCVPALIQLPILVALYNAIKEIVLNNQGVDAINKLLYFPWLHLSTLPDSSFFGLNLAIKPMDWTHLGIFLLLIPLITAGIQFIQSLMMIPPTPKQYPKDSPKEKKEKEEVEDAMVAVQGQMKFMLPLMIGFFAYQFPIGLAVYWNTSTLFSIFQQYKITGLDNLKAQLKSLGLKRD